MERIARLEHGATLQQANADIGRMIPIAFTKFQPPIGFNVKLFEQAHFQPAVRPLKESAIGGRGGVLWRLMGSIGIVLLIACANVANRMLVRGPTRSASALPWAPRNSA